VTADPPSEHEVRGAWFVAARDEVIARFGQDGLEVLVSAMPAKHQSILREATGNAWYPEVALQTCLHSLRLQLAGGHEVRFGELLESCTERGTGRFFATLLGLSSPRFVLKNVPKMWKSIRRGPGFVTVEPDGPTAMMLHYQCFPFFADPIYEELTVHSVRALVRLCTGTDPLVSIERSTGDSVDLRVDYG